MKKINKLCLAAVAFAGAFAMSGANAAPVPYSNVGHQNMAPYSFTAAHTGNISAYFAGSTAGYTNTLSLLVNGIDTGIAGLNNHASSYGQVLSFGNVHAGDSLVFKLNVLTTGDKFYSDTSMNTDHVNHVYSNAYAGDSLIPAGTYVAFEDLRNGGDFNYHDENFVFTNVGTNVASTPIPAAIWLFGTGIAGLVGMNKRKKQNSLAA
jgi:hypothetical protein